MNTTRQRYSIYRDNTLIASDLLNLDSVEKFARKDARREHSHERPACYVITGQLGFKRVGSHLKGKIVWKDKSEFDPTFGTPSIH